jgi:hypothetical protein
MTVRRTITTLTATALFSAALLASAALAPWDQAKVAELAKQLLVTTGALADAFYKQPVPDVGSLQTRNYEQLREDVKRIDQEARKLSGSIGEGAGRDETLPIYKDLTQHVRSARDEAKRVSSGADVVEKAGSVRAVLNQLGPYYEPDFQALQPVNP